ncbi:unnamed protein product [Mytilus coruscus]|uniref:SRCR domain-containing protein n=1 Tax=Mytilus coruscus TaxID=42192 RepID=A0A6J8DTJ8_MYTCO|nr:unnamed protein product [Mytilus coruscus]
MPVTAIYVTQMWKRTSMTIVLDTIVALFQSTYCLIIIAKDHQDDLKYTLSVLAITLVPWKFDRYFTVYICANSLAEVHCPRLYHVYIKSYSVGSGCGSIVASTAKQRLITLCDGERKCSPDTTRDSNLFHARFASVSYVCKRPNDPPVTESKQSSSSDHELHMTTISAANATTENDILPVLSLDNDHRIEIDHHSLNQTLYLCSLGWDDFDAGVLCKSFNRTWIGKATVVDNRLNVKTANYSLQCGGLETSLFDCNSTKDVKGCKLPNVAGAICCEGGKLQINSLTAVHLETR